MLHKSVIKNSFIYVQKNNTISLTSKIQRNIKVIQRQTVKALEIDFHLLETLYF